MKTNKIKKFLACFTKRNFTVPKKRKKKTRQHNKILFLLHWPTPEWTKDRRGKCTAEERSEEKFNDFTAIRRFSSPFWIMFVYSRQKSLFALSSSEEEIFSKSGHTKFCLDFCKPFFFLSLFFLLLSNFERFLLEMKWCVRITGTLAKFRYFSVKRATTQTLKRSQLDHRPRKFIAFKN